MALLHSTWLCIILHLLYFILLATTLLHYSSTSLYLILYISLLFLYFLLLDSTLLYHDTTSLYLILHYSTMALLHSIWLYITLLFLCFTLLDSTLLNRCYRGSCFSHSTKREWSLGRSIALCFRSISAVIKAGLVAATSVFISLLISFSSAITNLSVQSSLLSCRWLTISWWKQQQL